MDIPISKPPPSDAIVELAHVFDDAWIQFLSVEGVQADTPDNRGRLAAHLIVLSKTGESDRQRLAESALIYLRAFSAATRMSESENDSHPDRTVMEKKPEQGGSFSPEMVSAIEKALNLCLDELPLRIPSDALVTLSNSLLKNAAKGEREPARLHANAMTALKARGKA